MFRFCCLYFHNRTEWQNITKHVSMKYRYCDVYNCALDIGSQERHIAMADVMLMMVMEP